MEISFSSSSSWRSYGPTTSSQHFLSPASPPPSEKLLLKKNTRIFNYLDHRGYVSLVPVRRTHSLLLPQTGLQIHYKNRFPQVFCSKQREAFVLESGCMEDIYDALAERLVPTAAAASSSNYKHIVGLAGPPGAGKSTIASEVAQRINKLWPQKCISFDSQVEPSEAAIVLPMDGFHLYRHQLDAMEDPEEAHARRGAPWTFDPELLLRCLKTLRDQGSVYAPSFDHGVGDPVEDDIFIDVSNIYGQITNYHDMGLHFFLSRHKVVIVEGNYLLSEDGAWKDISTIFDEKWFVDVDIEVAMERVLKRHISTGKLPDVAKRRIDYNDRPNAEFIMKSKKNADLIMKSVDLSR